MSSRPVLLVFGSGATGLVEAMLDRLAPLAHGHDLVVVSEFPASRGRWIPYRMRRGVRDNRAGIRDALGGRHVRMSAMLLDPDMPYGHMRLLAFLFTPRVLVFNRNLDHFTTHPRSWPSLARHAAWRMREHVRWQVRPGGDLYTFAWRLRHPGHFARPVAYAGARLAGLAITALKAVLPLKPTPPAPAPAPSGVSVVVPSRDGLDLLRRLLPGLLRELQGIPSEVVVVDNGSTDGTAQHLQAEHPGVRVHVSAEPLSFAAAVNVGVGLAGHSHICLLNNDMVLEPGFFPALRQAFAEVPDLFCATAQIFFPPGVRRQETGKAVKPARAPDSRSHDFPLRCDEPVPGENRSYVLYGSGGCSLYDAAKLRQLGGFGEMYRPAYVEDLDVGYRAWLRHWPTVFVADARVVHHHRSTTSRYYSEEALRLVLDVNYLRFLARCVASPRVFRRLWCEATWRLNVIGAQHFPVFTAIAALRFAARAARWVEAPPKGHMDETLLLALGSGDVAVFPGRARRSGRPLVLVASPYLPYPLSHGGAVRIYNLMRHAARDHDQVLVAFADELATPPEELLALCVELVLVRRVGSHLIPSTERPDAVEEFDHAAFHAALRQTCAKWCPAVVQLEYTQMAAYAGDCASARTLLVEHDVTFDLFGQYLALGEDWETRRQYERWLRFERDAWMRVDRVAVMSEKDRALVAGVPAIVLPNGVDLDRFRPSDQEPEPCRLLFIGAFRHRPNLTALRFFLQEVWPALRPLQPTLHVIAGHDHLRHLEEFDGRDGVDLNQAGLLVEGFVADVRPAYRQATLVLAPLLASAGTNIKVLEAMAMGRVVVSSPAGINGIDLTPGVDVALAHNGAEMAQAIKVLLADAESRRRMERAARATVEQRFSWEQVGEGQATLYRELAAERARQAPA